MAVVAKQDHKSHRIFAVLGDGECNEGSVWEAAQAAVNFRLDNLVVIVDHNHMQSLDFCERTLHSGSLAQQWRSFGWNVAELDGHDHDALRKALLSESPNRPTVVIAHTVKGHRIPFMERDILWHYRFPHDGWEYDGAVTALHACKPAGVEDPYTPDGIPEPALPDADADIYRDHTLGATYRPTWFRLREAEK
jgi:transketolase